MTPQEGPDIEHEGGPKEPKEKKETERDERPEKKEIEEAGEEVVETFRKISEAGKDVVDSFDKLSEKTETLGSAFEVLEKAVSDGTITFDKATKAVDRFTKKLDSSGKKITATSTKITEALGTAAEGSKTINSLQAEQAGKIKEMIEEMDKVYEGMGRVAEAGAERAVLRWPEGVIPLTDEIKEDEASLENWVKHAEGWLEAQISALEEEDKPFAQQGWIRMGPIESMLGILLLHKDEPEIGTLRRKLLEEYEDRRRLHDYFWFYRRAGGTDAILEMAAVLPTGAVERAIAKEGVGEQMLHLQELSDDYEVSKETEKKLKDEAKELDDKRKEEEAKQKKAEAKVQKAKADEILEKMVRLSKGFKEDENVPDEEKGTTKRLAGRLFVLLGFSAQYGITELAPGGDFFIRRLMNLRKNYLKEDDRWKGRSKLWRHFSQELYFGGGPLSSAILEEDAKKLPDFGLEEQDFVIEEFEEKGGTKPITTKRVRITDPDKLKSLSFKALGQPENFFVASWADACFKADAGRKLLINSGTYFDRPDLAHFAKLDEDFEHLKGDERSRFFTLMLNDLIEFYKGIGFIKRMFLGDPEKGGKRWIYEPYEIKDPETGEVVETGLTFSGSDSERLGVGDSWASGEIHKKVDRVLRETNMISVPYAEHLLRQQLKLLGIEGIGPIRGLKEILDAIGFGGLLAMIFAPIIELFNQLKEDLKRGG